MYARLLDSATYFHPKMVLHVHFIECIDHVYMSKVHLAAYKANRTAVPALDLGSLFYRYREREVTRKNCTLDQHSVRPALWSTRGTGLAPLCGDTRVPRPHISSG